MSYKSILSALGMLSLLAVSGFAKGTRPTGELALVNGATVNNVPALAGTTLYSNSRIKTTNDGGAVIRLGKTGRIELGAGTDITLQLAPGIIGGTLSSGRIVISAPSDMQINLVTRDSSVISLPPQATRLVVDLRNGKTDVVAKSGAAKVATGGRISVIGLVRANGEVQGLVRTSAPESTIIAPPVESHPTMSLLLKATAGQSLDTFLTNRATRALGGFFYPGITCKDFFDNPKCVRRSPKR